MKIVIKDIEGGDLIKTLLKKQPQLNFNMIKSALRKRDIKINGKRVSATVFLNGGETVELYLKEKQSKQIEIAYQDDNILVAVKPQGMETTLADKSFSESECLEELIGFQPAHRIDKNTEGLVLFGKTTNAQNALVAGFKNGEILKTYTALVYGIPKEKEGELTAYLTKNPAESTVKISDSQTEGSVLIKTNYKVIENNKLFSLLSVQLLTGKTHQIRAHLAHIGLSVIGDDKYGNKKVNKALKQKKQCLCASMLGFNFSGKNFLNYLNQTKITVKPTFSLQLTDNLSD